jgi:glycerate-2-kinase
LGFRAVTLTDELVEIEARQAAHYMASIASTIERRGEPFEPPCALFSSGELVVTVGKQNGVGGRNQEFVLSAALRVAGSENIVIASVDTDGTDGPGFQFSGGSGEIPCLAGGIVDGLTASEAKARNVDILGSLKQHSATDALWALDSGVVASPNISVNDLTVALILGHSKVGR